MVTTLIAQHLTVQMIWLALVSVALGGLIVYWTLVLMAWKKAPDARQQRAVRTQRI
ncbi:MAG: hypothetical protein K2M79_03560 [Muribaculaceae bacterium]|nr:hypothetical protein [Muribaculaceae bacterium]